MKAVVSKTRGLLLALLFVSMYNAGASLLLNLGSRSGYPPSVGLVFVVLLGAISPITGLVITALGVWTKSDIPSAVVGVGLTLPTYLDAYLNCPPLVQCFHIVTFLSRAIWAPALGFALVGYGAGAFVKNRSASLKIMLAGWLIWVFGTYWILVTGD